MTELLQTNRQPKSILTYIEKEVISIMNQIKYESHNILVKSMLF